MKKIVITGSAKLQNEVQKWKKFWEDKGFEILDYPKFLDQYNFLAEYKIAHPEFHRQLENADIQFVMNEDKNGVPGYIGYASFAEINYGVVRKINHHQSLDIILLKLPDSSLSCREEIDLWLQLGWIKLFDQTDFFHK